MNESRYGIPPLKTVLILIFSVKWTFNGNVISDKEILTIPEISPDNVGTYACNASNLAGYEYQEVIFIIFYLLKTRLKGFSPKRDKKLLTLISG